MADAARLAEMLGLRAYEDKLLTGSRAILASVHQRGSLRFVLAHRSLGEHKSVRPNRLRLTHPVSNSAAKATDMTDTALMSEPPSDRDTIATFLYDSCEYAPLKTYIRWCGGTDTRGGPAWDVDSEAWLLD